MLAYLFIRKEALFFLKLNFDQIFNRFHTKPIEILKQNFKT